MTKQLKYTFGKKPSITMGVRLSENLVGEIKKIAQNEAVTITSVFKGILEVGVKEYWEEREVKQEREVKKPRKVGRPKKRITESKSREQRRTKGALKTGYSYCQYSGCPEKGHSYLKKNMVRNDDGLVFSSDRCKNNFRKENIEGGD